MDATMSQGEKSRAAINRLLINGDGGRGKTITPGEAARRYTSLVQKLSHIDSNEIVGEDALAPVPAMTKTISREALPHLEARERNILTLLSYGAKREEVMKVVGISRQSYTDITREIYKKIGVRKRRDVAIKWHNIIQQEADMGVVGSGPNYATLQALKALRGGDLPEPLWGAVILKPEHHAMMRLWCLGFTGPEIERELGITHDQFEGRLRVAYQRLGDVHSRADAVMAYVDMFGEV